MKQRQSRENSRKNKVRQMFCLVVASFFCLSMVPAVQAYFTAKLESNTLLINVLQHNKSVSSTTISADVVFEDNNSNDTGQSILTERMTMDLTEDDRYIYGYIRLEGYRDSGDIYTPSIQLHHMHHSTNALSAQMEGDALAVTFNKSEIVSWFSDWEESFKETHFTVTGQGYVMGMDLFDFTGSTSLTLFMQKSPEIPKGDLEGPVLEEEPLNPEEVAEDNITEEDNKTEDDETDATDDVDTGPTEEEKGSPEMDEIPEEGESEQGETAYDEKQSELDNKDSLQEHEEQAEQEEEVKQADSEE